MPDDRAIGRIVKVKTYQALVELAPETTSYVKSSYGGIHAIAVINSFVVVPVGSERVVAIVTGLDMAEETEASYQRQVLVIAKPRRTMWISLIGTITQDLSGTKRFEYGVRRYPELDNPVWASDQSDLDVIFERDKQAADPKRVIIGRSPVFTDYDVTIDVDRFFGKHAAILGNTGAGKSCTVTAVLRAVLEKPMPNARFVIFDTNNEYEAAFSLNGKPLFNRLVLRNSGDVPAGLWLPHWFMNSLDYLAFFRPGEGAQAPLLFKAISAARSRSQQKSARLTALSIIEDATNQLLAMVGTPATGGAAYHGKKNLREQVDGALAVGRKYAAALGDAFRVYEAAFVAVRTGVAADGPLDPTANDLVRTKADEIRARLGIDRAELSGDNSLPVGVDSPVHFDFDKFVDEVFPEELAREAQRDSRLRSYVGTLQLRLEQARQDPRYAFLFRVQPFGNALASFLRLILGTAPNRHFESDPPPWAPDYLRQYPEPQAGHQVTILDLSQLASEVLENVTALLGRLILEFMQRNASRGEYPVVLVLEEAHHYIPARVATERQQRARDVFEKIAKEGRKFGLSLVVASQRPSELSRTVLAQCNSFIVHRIQNPDDPEYFKSVISGINRELLDQLPSLAQQQAIVLGDCVSLPLQVRISSIDPRPHSQDPQFVRCWSSEPASEPDFEGIAARWQGEAAPKEPGHGSGESKRPV